MSYRFPCGLGLPQQQETDGFSPLSFHPSFEQNNSRLSHFGGLNNASNLQPRVGRGPRGIVGRIAKVKSCKRDLLENHRFFCDSCDREFKCHDKFTEHCNGHAECSYDGCNYIAAPKLVQLHITLQHKTGLIQRVQYCKDIEKWRAERRKNYPSVAHIEKKKEMELETKLRGNILETKYFGRSRGRKRRGGPFAKISPKRNQSKYVAHRTVGCRQTTCEKSAQDPLSYLLDEGSDEPHLEKPLSGDSIAPSFPNVTGGLGNLMSSYGNITDSEEDDTNTQGISHDSCLKRTLKKGKMHSSRQVQERRDCTNNVKVMKGSLLEKLLSNDIRHERNIMMQCVKFIVKKGFFDHQINMPRGNMPDIGKPVVNYTQLYEDEVWSVGLE